MKTMFKLQILCLALAVAPLASFADMLFYADYAEGTTPQVAAGGITAVDQYLEYVRYSWSTGNIDKTQGTMAAFIQSGPYNAYSLDNVLGLNLDPSYNSSIMIRDYDYATARWFVTAGRDSSGTSFNSNYATIAGSTAPPAGLNYDKWYFVATTWEYNSGTGMLDVSIYARREDQSVLVSSSQSAAVTDPSTWGNSYIYVGYNNPSGTPTSGTVHEAGIWDTVMTSEQLLTLSESQHLPEPATMAVIALGGLIALRRCRNR